MTNVVNGGKWRCRWGSCMIVVNEKSDDKRWELFCIDIDVNAIVKQPFHRSTSASASIQLPSDPLDIYIDTNINAERHHSIITLTLILLSSKRVINVDVEQPFHRLTMSIGICISIDAYVKAAFSLLCICRHRHKCKTASLRIYIIIDGDVERSFRHSVIMSTLT